MYTIDKLKKLSNKPRVHGNGFIQLDLDDNRRLNFWGHEAIPKQKVKTPIHNHRFDYISTILKGDLIHNVYTVFPGDMYDVYYCDKQGKEETQLKFDGWSVDAELLNKEVLIEDDTYSLDSYEYHEIIPVESSVTLMTKLEIYNTAPCVLVPHDKTPDNIFKRDMLSEEQLWDIIEECLNG